MIIVQLAAAVITAWTVTVLILRGWSPVVLAARGRGQLVTGLVDAIVVLALVRAVAPPPGPWVWLWLPAAAAVGLGLAGVILRWPHLDWQPIRRRPAHPARTRAAWRIWAGGLYLAAGAGIVLLLR